MRKKITKRILALVLALALCTALMLPGLAATKPTDSTNHVHSWVSILSAPRGPMYRDANSAQHEKYYEIDYMCTICAARQTLIINSTYEGHTHGAVNCPYCGHKLINT